MIPDLKARLKAVAEKPKPPAASCECMAIESRVPLLSLGDIAAVSSAHVKRLGLMHPDWDVERALFLDTETTGLRGAGTVAFLVGLGWVEGDQFVVRQLMMRDYPEEPHLLRSIADMLPRFDCCITFNGKSFDMPLLRDRFTMARLRDRWHELLQLDLLHAARRTWKLRLGTCSLGALEEKVLGIPRVGDLPGAEVPERFFQYLKCGDMTLLDDVLRHNEQDIRTLAVLLTKLAGVYEAPERQVDMMDVFSAGRALERIGERELARRCFTVASVSALSRQARMQLALSYRRDMGWAKAAEVYRGLIDRNEGDVATYIALAVLLERRLFDVEGALAITEKALWRFSGGGFLASADAETIEGLERRRARLSKKLAGRA